MLHATYCVVPENNHTVPMQGFLFQPYSLGIPVSGGGGGFMKTPLPLLNGEDRNISILEQFNMYSKY